MDLNDTSEDDSVIDELVAVAAVHPDSFHQCTVRGPASITGNSPSNAHGRHSGLCDR